MYERGMYERGMYEHGAQERGVVLDRRPGERRRIGRRRPSGPRPVRPAVNAVPLRPAEAERPQAPSGARQVSLPVPGVRTLAQAPRAVPRGPVLFGPVLFGPVLFGRVRRVLAGLAVTVAAAAVVVGLGVLADSAAAVRAAERSVSAPQGTVVVTVRDEHSAWDVARRIAPGASGPEVATLAERIVTENSLGSVPLHPGQVLRVTAD
jgi:hypothetical protein